MGPQIAKSLADLLAVIVKGLAEKGTPAALDQAREIVEAARIACDEATARINEAAKVSR